MYKLTNSFLHKILIESINQVIFDKLNISIKESVDDYGNIGINAYYNNQIIGYMIIVIHHNIEDLDSEISETDSYETATAIIKKLDYNKPVVELADVDVKKEFRGKGISKILLEYALEKYKKYQFYLRVCPTDGVDEITLAKSVIKYGFINVENTENGTFLIKK